MKALSVSKCGAQAVCWVVPCVTALSISACGGGGDSSSAAGSRTDAADVVATTLLESLAPVTGSPPATVAGVETSPAAPTEVATSAANATLFVAGVQPGAKSAPGGASRRRAEEPSSPAQWLDAEPPVGTASAPVMVVVAGALPQETATQATTRGGAVRSAR